MNETKENFALQNEQREKKLISAYGGIFLRKTKDNLEL